MVSPDGGLVLLGRSVFVQRLLPGFDARAFVQWAGHLDDHPVVRLEAVFDDEHVAIRWPDLDPALFHDILLVDKPDPALHVGDWTTEGVHGLNRNLKHRARFAHRHAHAGGHALQKNVVRVGELAMDADGALTR